MCVVRHEEVSKRHRGTTNLVTSFVVLAVLLCLSGLTVGCGAAVPSATAVPEAPASALSLSPGTATMAPREQLQFAARRSGASNVAVTWSATAGTISSNGFFTAPQVASVTHVIITATTSTRHAFKDGSDLGAPDSASATGMIITPSASLTITSSALPVASPGIPYSTSLSAIGGLAPYRWSLVTGGLPLGIELQLSSGVIKGMTAVSGSYPFSVQVTDASGQSATAAFRLTVMVPSVTSLAITNSALPSAAATAPYTASLSASGGVTPYRWSLVTGALPPGIQLQASSGFITGMTTRTGSYPISVKVTDASGHIATAAFSLTVSSSSTSSASGFA